jgi:DNA-binding response OmpR family regulator
MANKAILVIDSDTETAQDIVAALEHEDYLVFISPAAEFAVDMARKVKPALILVNTTMAEASGLDICTKIHETDELSSVPIIALAAFQGEVDPRYRSEYGIVDLLGKPFTHEELVAKIVEALSMQQPLEETASWEKVPVEKTGKSDRIVVRLKEKEEEKNESAQTRGEEPETSDQPLQTDEVTQEEEDRVFVAKRPLRRQGRSGTKLTVPVIAAALIILLGAVGAVVYKMGLIPGAEVKKTVAIKPSQPAQKEPVQGSPAPEQKPQQEVLRDKSQLPATVAPPAAVPSPPPPPAPEKKPAGKAMHSVQIGAFKNEKNAEALAKQYTEKGYDAFVQTVPKDKEMLHRVLVGKFEDRKEAWKLAGEITEKENVKAVVVTGN